jgi:hypothetical protein
LRNETKPVATAALRFVHLSDIHFNRRSDGVGFDPDEDLRNEILRDLKSLVKALGPIHAVFVSGDIAYAGKAAEYESASKWLDQVCEVCGCPLDAAYVSPGNHDVDHDIIRANPLLQDAQDGVRSKPTDTARESHLRRRLEEPEAGKLLYTPLQQFNEFAGRYGCSFYPDRESYAWESDLQLNDGSILRIKGLNSTLLSGPSDSEGALFLGSRATTLSRKDGVEYLTICHHPPNWLVDRKAAADALNDRARIQLFGHEHDLRIDPGRDNVKIFAGAVNPHRDEPGWCPGYNVIEVWIENTEDAAKEPLRKMIVNIHAREWQQRPTQFREHKDRDGKLTHRVEFELPAWAPEHPLTEPTMQTAMAPSEPHRDSASSGGGAAAAPQRRMTPRELVNRFFRLSVSKKSEIAGHLNLLEAADQSLPDFERYKRALVRAKDRNALAELEALVVKAERE